MIIIKTKNNKQEITITENYSIISTNTKDYTKLADIREQEEIERLNNIK